MRKLDATSYRTMPWKNGGGTTTEIARSPEVGSIDDFDWRLSMAQVGASGPFSRFPGVDRSIAILEGEGFLLVVEGRGETRLDRGAAPLSFPADVDISATLVGGSTEDLNVMTRRGRYRHLLTRARFDAPTTVASLGDVTILVVARGMAAVRRACLTEELAPRDALVFEGGAPLELLPHAEVELLTADLWRC
ncbi:MAG: HutD family protein [Polyangiaceae bacterium]